MMKQETLKLGLEDYKRQLNEEERELLGHIFDLAVDLYGQIEHIMTNGRQPEMDEQSKGYRKLAMLKLTNEPGLADTFVNEYAVGSDARLKAETLVAIARMAKDAHNTACYELSHAELYEKIRVLAHMPVEFTVKAYRERLDAIAELVNGGNSLYVTEVLADVTRIMARENIGYHGHDSGMKRGVDEAIRDTIAAIEESLTVGPR